MTDAGQHPAPATDSRPSRPILILLSDGFADWEIALLSAAAPDYYTPMSASPRSTGAT